MVAARRSFDELLANVAGYPARLEPLGGSLLTNLAMIAEIPAPTFQEGARARFLQTRFAEVGYGNCSVDAEGNVTALLPSSPTDQSTSSAPTLLLVAHLDAQTAADVDHTVSLTSEAAYGAAVADNALGLATLASLPTLLKQLEVEPRVQIVALASTGGLGVGDIRGLRFFLDNTALSIGFGVCVEGVQLGRLSYSSIGMIRGTVSCAVPADAQLTAFGGGGAITVLNEVIDGILALPTPSRPKTSVVLSRVQGGSSGNRPATSAYLDFEIRSESGRVATSLLRHVARLVAEVRAAADATVELNIHARRQPGGLDFDHPLVAGTRRVMERLELPPRVSPSTSELAAFISAGIPAVTLGITTGHEVGTLSESVSIEAMYLGVAQLVAIIEAIGDGYCA